ncbi:MAG: cell division protein FtsL [Lachnospiraceae bacterium]|nr:cell division protein FtsL [Lachnospiraceae bacterium]
MATTHGRGRTAYRDQDEYIYGNTARALQPVAAEIPTEVKLSHRARRNRERARHMNFGYVFFLTLAIVATGIGCLQYLQLQSDVTNSVKRISVLESRLNEIKAENDDTESRIKGTVGLEEIKKRAMNELGMQYATPEQIVKYESDDTDYVRQYIDID